MHFINRCTWRSSQYYIIISILTLFMRISQKLVFHQSKCICAIMRILSTTAMYVSSSSFMYLRFPCYCDACLNSSDLRVGLKTLLNTILERSKSTCWHDNCRDRKSRAACAESFALWQQAIIEIMLAISLTIACSRYIYNRAILHAHPVRGESHIQRNTTGEVATTVCKSTC